MCSDNRLEFCLTDDNPDNVKDKVQRLPKSLSESVEALNKDTVLKDMIGDKLLVAVKGVRKVHTFFFSFFCINESNRYVLEY